MTQKGTGPIDWVKCGTVANCRRHYRLGEKPCEPCRLANNRAKLEREQRRKAKR